MVYHSGIHIETFHYVIYWVYIRASGLKMSMKRYIGVLVFDFSLLYNIHVCRKHTTCGTLYEIFVLKVFGVYPGI